MGIHQAILDKVAEELTTAMITNIDGEVQEAKSTKVGAISIGPLQGDPDPDRARISVELYCNDPDQTLNGSGTGKAFEAWDDTVEEIEVGGAITWRRRFTAKVRCLLESTREAKSDALEIASTIRSRLEAALLGIDFNGLSSDNEHVSRGIFSDTLRSQSIQAGGPDAYDFHIKVRFEVLTTRMVGE